MFRRPAGGTHEGGAALRRARRRTLPVAILVVGLLWGGLAWLEHTRHVDADRLFDRLADQTAVSALDIEDMVIEMQNAVGSAVTSVQRYASQAHRSSEDVAELSENLARIIERATRLGPEIESVNRGVQVQSHRV